MPLELNALTVAAAVAWSTFLLWIAGAVWTLRGLGRQQPLISIGGDRLTAADAPLVSILVPARNEEHRVLDASVRSMLAQDYGRFEVIVVNDCSTDATGVILRAIAATDKKLHVIDGAEPPALWLGKPHALQQALEASRGQWVLATDADMIFAPTVVRTAMAMALDASYTAVTLIPHVDCFSFWERVFMPTFGWFMLMAMPVERVNDPERQESLGVGGFFLVRRAVLEHIGGYRAVRSEVAEDLRMAEILKRAGARLRLEYAPALLRTRMQTTLGEIWEGFTKNLFAGTKFSLWRAVAGALTILIFAVTPVFVALLCLVMLAAGKGSAWMELFIPVCAVWITQVLIFSAINRAWDVPVPYALAVPLGHALFVAILLNSAFRVASGRGVVWKGRRFYERAGVRPPSQGAAPGSTFTDE